MLHQHLCGRSPRSLDRAWQWGESPFFPAYADRLAWSAGKQALRPSECEAIVARTVVVLREVYGEPSAQGIDSQACGGCSYTAPASDLLEGRCPGCRREVP